VTALALSRLRASATRPEAPTAVHADLATPNPTSMAITKPGSSSTRRSPESGHLCLRASRGKAPHRSRAACACCTCSSIPAPLRLSESAASRSSQSLVQAREVGLRLRRSSVSAAAGYLDHRAERRGVSTPSFATTRSPALAPLPAYSVHRRHETAAGGECGRCQLRRLVISLGTACAVNLRPGPAPRLMPRMPSGTMAVGRLALVARRPRFALLRVDSEGPDRDGRGSHRETTRPVCSRLRGSLAGPVSPRNARARAAGLGSEQPDALHARPLASATSSKRSRFASSLTRTLSAWPRGARPAPPARRLSKCRHA